MLHDLCAVSQETWNLVIEYIFYGSVFVVGLVILLLMKRRSVRPAAVLAKEGAEKAIARIDRFLGSLGREKNNYAFPAKLLRLSGEIGDLIGALLWLADDNASGFVTGTVIPVDGGFSAYSGV